MLGTIVGISDMAFVGLITTGAVADGGITVACIEGLFVGSGFDC